MTLSDGSTFSQDVEGAAGAAFFGWVGAGVTSFTLSSGVDFAFGRFVEARGQSVPEPATIALLGVALLGLAGGRRRSTRRAND